MKLSTKLIIVALALLVALCVAVLTSCATPAPDPKNAEATLTENGYTIRNSDSISGYWVSNGVKKISKIIVAEKEINPDDDLELVIMYFEDAAAAETAFPTVQRLMADEVDDLDEIIELSGNMIYFGDKGAVSDAS